MQNGPLVIPIGINLVPFGPIKIANGGPYSWLDLGGPTSWWSVGTIWTHQNWHGGAGGSKQAPNPINPAKSGLGGSK